jgi:hypothetical protein
MWKNYPQSARMPKFTLEGEIEVALGRVAQTVQLTVRDTETGIAPSSHTSLNDPSVEEFADAEGTGSACLGSELVSSWRNYGGQECLWWNNIDADDPAGHISRRIGWVVQARLLQLPNKPYYAEANRCACIKP